MNLPLINAGFNGLSILALLAGFVAIKRDRVALHRACMGAALALSALFLAGYLAHHYQAGGHVPFRGTGWIRPVYFAILITHTPLAALVPFFASRAAWLAIKGRVEEHRRLVRWVWPVWMYVAVTGTLIYLLVYVWYAAPPPAAG